MFLQIALTKFGQLFSIWDFVLFPVYFAVILLMGVFVQRKRIKTNPEYKYYTMGLAAKLLGALFFALVYTLYYYGGDTTNYFESSINLLNLAEKDFWVFLKIMGGNLSMENFSHFDRATGYPMYMKKPNSFAIVRLSAPFVLLGCKSFYLTTMVLAYATYTGVWRLYLVFVREFPRYSRQIAIGVLFMPSVVCWGSGIIKDSYMISALGWFVYSFHSLVKGEKGGARLKYYLYMAVAIYLMIQIKAFNFYAMAACVGLWFIFEVVSKIKNELVKVLLYPVFFVTISVAAMYLFTFLSQFAGGNYSSLDAMLEQAVVIQQDLTRDAYGENSFDIGTFDPTITGILSKAPKAIEAGLFRPYPWEARNMFMMLSALENMFLLVLTLFVLLRIRFDYLMGYLFKSPYIIMLSIGFSLLFAFSVGLVTANFGALVRYKIPLIPFYVTALLVVYNKHRDFVRAKESC